MESTALLSTENQSHAHEAYLLTNETYKRLNSIRLQGWNAPAGDAHFQNRRAKTLSPNNKAKRYMFEMMQSIAAEMNSKTSAFEFESSAPKVLDLCMAPGGFLAYFLRMAPDGNVDAITLPKTDGGHQIILPFGDRDERVRVTLADVTMFAAELGVRNVPNEHPEAGKLRRPWPYSEPSYDLVICDGQALWTQKLADYRQVGEQSRLFNSQLVLSLKRVRPGGTIIALLHKSHKWRTFALLQMFSKFSDVELFKSKRYHTEKSSFYLVAKNMRSHSDEAATAMEGFRRSWMRGTFPESCTLTDGEKDVPNLDVLWNDFGPKFFRLIEPVWEIQAAALENATWIRAGDTT